MITLSVEEILNAQQAFQSLVTNTSLAAAIKLHLLPITRSFDQHVKDINEIRTGLFRKHGTPIDGDLDNYELKPENKEAINAMQREWKAVIAATRTIPGKRLKFENVSGAPLSTADMMNLEWLIEFPAEVEDDAPAQAVAATA